MESPKVSGTQNGGTATVPYKAVFGVGFPLHRACIHVAYIGEYLHFRYLNFVDDGTPKLAVSI